jgi:serine/threonine-protein kinase RsbT
MRPRPGTDAPSIRPKRLGLAPRCSAGAGQSGGSVCSSGVTIGVRTENDVAQAFLTAWSAGRDLGFSAVDQTKVATAVAELGNNIVQYAGAGTIVVRPIGGEPDVLEIIASDDGPGIADIEAVLRPDFRSRTGMGLGLKGVQRLMDAFDIASECGRGTTVTIRKARG